MLKLVIVDDDKIFLNNIYRYVTDYSCLTNIEFDITLYDNSKALNDDIWKKTAYDIYLLDVEIPQELSIASTDLCIILSNVLDNAIEANLQIASLEMRWVKILLRMDHHMVYLVVKNAYRKQPIKNILYTSKQNQLLHGWGIKSIQSTLKKYHGHATYGYKDTYFETKISLNSYQ